jgi:hypothetical protein
MKPLILGIVFLASLALSQELRVNQIQGNREVKLIDAYRDNTAASSLHASFGESGSTNRLEIVFPAHSATPHEFTIMKIIQGSVDWSSPGPDFSLNVAPSKAIMEVVFSVPITNHYEFSRWYLVSLKSKDVK